MELPEARQRVVPSPNGACRERHPRAQKVIAALPGLRVGIVGDISGNSRKHRAYTKRRMDSRIPRLALIKAGWAIRGVARATLMCSAL